MPRKRTTGLRCTICNHILGRTTPWGVVSYRRAGRSGVGVIEILCWECADDLHAFLNHLRIEHNGVDDDND